MSRRSRRRRRTNKYNNIVYDMLLYFGSFVVLFGIGFPVLCYLRQLRPSKGTGGASRFGRWDNTVIY
jgi:hypothetical protein